MPPVEQIKAKRAGVGLRAYDPDRACPGYTLFAPSTGGGEVYLIDLEGNTSHTWRMPYPPGLYGYLTERGTLFYNGQIPDDSFVGSQPWRGGAALETDWLGRVLWEVNHPHHHHDGRRLRNGNVVLLCARPIPRDLAARVQGGRPGTEHNGEMYGDYLVEMTIEGKVVWEWRSWEWLLPETDRITALQDRRHEWSHGNTVEELPDGNLVVSFRQISAVVIVERTTGKIIWRLGAPPLSHQHAPTLLANGNLLIFDNGTHRLDHPQPYSRVIEVDPTTKEIVWTYQEGRVIDFYSPMISNAQRLPNGNTLICEGNFGRLFEVTPEGEVVWEYVNPYFGDSPQGIHNGVFRAFRYSAEEIERARATG